MDLIGEGLRLVLLEGEFGGGEVYMVVSKVILRISHFFRWDARTSGTPSSGVGGGMMVKASSMSCWVSLFRRWRNARAAC